MPLLYLPTHQWIDAADVSRARVGITHHAQDALGDIVFVEMPAIGQKVHHNQPAAVVESVKTAADVLSPASGTVTAINAAVVADPALLNTDPTGEGWLFEMTLDNPAELAALLSADPAQA